MSKNSKLSLSRRGFLSAAGALGASSVLSVTNVSAQTANATEGTKTSPAKTDHDYIIIGGGTAGLVMAARLSENPNNTVVVIEAGGENTFETGQYAAGVGGMWAPATNWNFKSAPQAALNGRQINQPRGKVLGGSAAINVGSWSRGTKSNYESWDLPGWDWNTHLEKWFPINRNQSVLRHSCL